MKKKRYIQPETTTIERVITQVICTSLGSGGTPSDPLEDGAKEVTLDTSTNEEWDDEDDPDYNPLTYHGYDGGYKGYNPWED